MESMAQRVMSASIRFFMKLAMMPESRLAGFVFQQRCVEVDAGRARQSWCYAVKQSLEELGWKEAWRTRDDLSEDWQSALAGDVRRHFEKLSDEAIQKDVRLVTFSHYGPAKLPGWLDFAVKHPGALMRLKLRSGKAPLMLVAGESAKIPAQERKCVLCGTGKVESAEHFVSECPVFAIERAECLQRLEAQVGPRVHPHVRHAIAGADPELFLGDGWLRRLPDGVAATANSTVCNFLMMAWRKRDPMWANFCEEGKPYRLKS